MLTQCDSWIQLEENKEADRFKKDEVNQLYESVAVLILSIKTDSVKSVNL